MNLYKLWAVAGCEMRSCSRLARTWVVIAISFLFATIAYLWVCVLHMAVSTSAPSAQVQNPRFIVGESASMFIGLFAIGIIFLAFDIRARDIRDRIGGIIDAKPISNIELVVGRLGGILILLCIPILVFLSLVLLHGALAGLVGWSFGAPIEIWSVLSFITWDIVPQLAWWGGLVMLLAVILRYRLLVVLMALGIFALYAWISSKLSWGHMELAGAVTSQIVHPSDVAPVFVTGTILLHRIGWMLLSIGLLLIAATLLPRLLARRGFLGLAGLGTFTAGVLVHLGLFGVFDEEREQTNTWLQLHQMQEVSSFPDVQKVSGEIDIKPGKRIELNLLLTVSPPQHNLTDQVTFTLNPGYKIDQLTIDENKIDDYSFEDGLLTIPSNHFGASTVSLEIVAKGKPDHRFAYLDARIDLEAASVLDVDVVMARFLGNNNLVFQSNYVALLPGASWYPTAGVAIGRDDLQKYPRDHFTLDVTVTVPKKWQVAGPGKEVQQTENNHTTKYRFRTDNPVVDIALIGSKFERASMRVQGIEFEVLYSAKHRKTFAAVEPLLPQLREWVNNRLTIIEQEYGLRYPYKTLTLVEIPAHLRVVGGGWSMDSTLSAPGVVMIRETGFPTARFDVQFEEQEGEGALGQLLAYFDNDLQGGNLLSGIARNFVYYQMSPTGQGAIALNYFIEDLVGDLTVERLPYYSIDTALSPLGSAQIALAGEVVDENVAVSISVGVPGTQNTGARSGSMIVRERSIHSINSWGKIEERSLSDLNFQEEPSVSYKATLLRNTYALAALKNWVDRKSLGLVLNDLLQQYRGSNYSYENFRDVAVAIEPKFELITQNWLNTNKLPGYLVSEASIEKLITDDLDNSIFQTVFKLQNAESVSGVVNVYWFEEQPFGANEDDPRPQNMPPMLVEPDSSYQFAIKSELKPTRVTIEAPMSLNRYPITLTIPNIDNVPASTSSPYPDITPISWKHDRLDQVIVDDLDPGFSVFGEPQELQIPDAFMIFVEAGLQVAGIGREMDNGLPVSSWWLDRLQWTRTQRSGFGRYRNTFVQIPSIRDWEEASEESVFSAEFATDLPNTGVWALEFSTPDRVFKESEDYESEAEQLQDRVPNESDLQNASERGSIELTVRVNDESIPIELSFIAIGDVWEALITVDEVEAQSIVDVAEKSSGQIRPANWVALGSFDISDAHVVVEISKNNEIPITFADAVRWTFLENRESNPNANSPDPADD